MLPCNDSMAGLLSEKENGHPESIRPAALALARMEQALMPALSPCSQQGALELLRVGLLSLDFRADSSTEHTLPAWTKSTTVQALH